jgi:hypothetical protein
MYIIMCKIYEYPIPYDDFNADTTERKLVSVHPVDAVKTLDEVHDWMFRKPETIVEHLNAMGEEQWYLAAYDRNESHVTIWNQCNTKERLYTACPLK